MWTRRRAVIALCLLAPSALSAAQPRMFGGKQRYKRFNSAGIAFDYPDDWQQMTVAPPMIAVFTKGAETSITVTRERVNFPQVFNEDFAAYEAKAIPEGYPGATGIVPKSVDHGTVGKVLQVDFKRPGITQGGRPAPQLQLRLLAIPAATWVYRITCLAKDDEFEKRYEDLFKHMIASLVITAS